MEQLRPQGVIAKTLTPSVPLSLGKGEGEEINLGGYPQTPTRGGFAPSGLPQNRILQPLTELGGAKIAVTGGAGFIGSHLVERLLSLRAQVTVVDNLRFGNKISHLEGCPGFLFYKGDIRDGGLLKQAFHGTEVVFHLAALVGVEETQQDPLEVLDVEVGGTAKTLDAAVGCGVKRVVFASSSEVYGERTGKMSEDSPVSPISTYAVAKVVGEEFCRAFHHKYGLEYVSLRYFNVYGPRQDQRFVIPRFITGALARQPLVIYGDGLQTRDFTHVEDAINVTLLAAVLPQARCHVLNVGTGVSVTISELAHFIASFASQQSPVNIEYAGYSQWRPRAAEVINRAADISRMEHLLSYRIRHSWKEGLSQLITEMRGKAP